MSHNYIDVHAHFLSDAYCSAMRRANVFDVDGFPIPKWTASDAIKLMDDGGIAFAFLSISAPGVGFEPAASVANLARSVNDEAAEIVSAHKSRFGAFALLPLPDIEASLKEISRIFDELQLDGIVLYTNIDGIYLGDPRFDPIFDELNRRKAVVFVHPVHPPGFDMTRLGFPAPTIEYPFDTTRMVINLIASGTLRRCPDIKIIVCHGGGTLAFLADRITRHLMRFSTLTPALSAEEITSALGSLYYDLASTSRSSSIEAILDVVPESQLLYGSDNPFIPRANIEAALAELNSSSALTPELRRRIACDNAIALFPRLAALR